jgi:hypothetical protein
VRVDHLQRLALHFLRVRGGNRERRGDGAADRDFGRLALRLRRQILRQHEAERQQEQGNCQKS